MRFVVPLALALALAAGLAPISAPAHVTAQAPDVNASVLVELKGIRSTLERLLASTEGVERIQRATLALQQMQVYDTRLTSLRSEQAQLATRESALAQRVVALDGSVRMLQSGVGPNGLPLPPAEGGADTATEPTAAAQDQFGAATRDLQQLRERQLSLQREIAGLQESIARLEKLVDAAVIGR